RRLDAYFRRSLHEAFEQENSGRKHGDAALCMRVDLVGERPSGENAPNSIIVELATEASRFVGVEPKLEQSSTDSNLPISLGIPALTLCAGGTAASSHTLDEWYDPKDRDLGLKRGLLTILGVVGLARR